MDTYEGDPQSPASLHKYLYADASPIDAIDPTGFITDYTPYGYAIEARVQTQYIIDYPANDVLFGRPGGLGRKPLLKPDILDRTRKIWMDVKPMSFSGVADAAATWNVYNKNFGRVGYAPDRTWLPGIQNPIPYDGKLFFIVNVQGVLFYTADVSDPRTLNDLKTFSDVRKFLNYVNNSKFWFQLSIFSTGVAAGIGALVNTINQQDLYQLKMDEKRSEVEELLAA
jgi:hypothetical protein